MTISLAIHCIQHQLNALSKLPTVVSSSIFESIVDLVIKTKDNYGRILMAGVGKNAHIAAKISETLSSLGIPSFHLNIGHLGHGDYGQITDRDLIIHISRSGKTQEMLEAIKHISLISSAVQVLIHCNPKKPQNELVNIDLCIGEAIEGDEHGLAPTTSTTMLLCFLDCISVEASRRINFQRLGFLKLHPSGSLGEMLKKELEQTVKPRVELEAGREFT